MPAYPLVNGRYHQFADVVLNLDGESLRGVTAIEYSDSNERGEVRGAARQALGWTAGEYKAEGSIELLRPQFDELLVRVGPRFYDVTFTITVTYGAHGLPLTMDELVRCFFKNRGNSHSPGTDALKVKLDLGMDGIIFNDQLPYEDFRR